MGRDRSYVRSRRHDHGSKRWRGRVRPGTFEPQSIPRIVAFRPAIVVHVRVSARATLTDLWNLCQSDGINRRWPIFCYKRLDVGKTFTGPCFGAQHVGAPAVRPHARRKHLPQEGMLPLTEKPVCAVDASRFIQDEFPDAGKNRFVPGVLRGIA